MTATQQIPVIATLYVLVHDGIEYVIPPKEELEEIIGQIKSDLATQETALKEATSELGKLVVQNEIKRLTDVLAQRRALLEKYLPIAETRLYTLIRPTYHEHIQYKAFPGARNVQPNGTILYDDEKLQEAMLPKTVKSVQVGATTTPLSEEAVKALSPDIAFRLYQRLKDAIAPDAGKLPFRL